MDITKLITVDTVLYDSDEIHVLLYYLYLVCIPSEELLVSKRWLEIYINFFL